MLASTPVGLNTEHYADYSTVSVAAIDITSNFKIVVGVALVRIFINLRSNYSVNTSLLVYERYRYYCTGTASLSFLKYISASLVPSNISLSRLVPKILENFVCFTRDKTVQMSLQVPKKSSNRRQKSAERAH